MKSRHTNKVIAALVTFTVLVGLGVCGLFALTDERLTRWSAALLNKHLSGHFDIVRVHYAFPAHISIDGMKARSPSGAPVLAVEAVRVDARLLPLLIGRLIVDAVSVDGFRADVRVPPGKEASEFLDTFIPDFELPALRKIHSPVRLEVRRISVEHGDVMIQRTPEERTRLREIRITDANAWLSGDELRTGLTWQASVSVKAPKAEFDESLVRAKVAGAEIHFARADFAVSAMSFDFPGFDAGVSGRVQGDENGDVAADVHGDITVDTKKFLPKVHTLDAIKKAAHGTATWHFEAQHEGVQGAAKIVLANHELQIYMLPIKAFTVSATHDRRKILLDKFRFELGEGSIDGHGTLSLGDDPNVPLAEHDLTFKCHAMAVRELARPWVSLPALLPEAVSFAISSKGRALWPPTSQVDLDIVPEGLPGESWPGLPKTMELKGRFLTHPDLLEILKLEVAIDKVPDFGIMGAVPLREQSALDIIHELHGPNPKGPLHRIPVAPTDKRP